VADPFGYQSDMGRHPELDDDALDRLISAPGSGRATAPALAALLAAAAAGDTGPVPGEEAAVAAFRKAMRRPGFGVHAKRKPRAARLATVRLAVAGAAAGGLLASGVAAAATGSLPDAAQQVARDMLAHLRVTVPGPAGTAGQRPAERIGGKLGGGGAAGGTGTAGNPADQTAPPVGAAKRAQASEEVSGDPAKSGRNGRSADVSRPNAPVPVPNHGVGNPQHPRRDVPGSASVGGHPRGRGADASSGRGR
jgi:hypothetical protein